MEDRTQQVFAWKLPTTTSVSELFAWCLAERGVDRLLLSTRLEQGPSSTLCDPSIDSLVSETFGDHLLARRLVREWPGTELIGHDGLVYEIAFEESLIEPMARIGPTLGDWSAGGPRPLPEDPCLYRLGEPSPVLVSVTHERDAWIVARERPPFQVGDPVTYSPDDLFVPPASRGFLATVDSQPRRPRPRVKTPDPRDELTWRFDFDLESRSGQPVPFDRAEELFNKMRELAEASGLEISGGFGAVLDDESTTIGNAGK